LPEELVGGEQSMVAKAHGGEGAPAGKWWQEIAGELHWSMAKLVGGSRELECV
jgi:hypothetical protein